MKGYLLLLTVALIGRGLLAQPSQGKITYQMLVGDPPESYKMINMWFTPTNYIYQYKTGDNQDRPIPSNHKYSSAQDSLSNIKLKSDFKEEREEIEAMQTWYGELGNDVVIYSSFDQNKKTYCIRDTLSFVNWRLLPDTMTISKISCQKAIGKYKEMDYEAWFALSIPTPVAPLQLRGLPGLLIKATNTTTHVSITMVELEWPIKSSVAIQPCSNSPFISKQELARINAEQQGKFYQTIEQLKKEKKLQEKTINQ